MQSVNRTFVTAPDYETFADEAETRRVSYNRPVNMTLCRAVYPDFKKDKFDSSTTYYTIIFDGNGQEWVFKTEEERNEVLDGILDKLEIT